MSKLGLFFDTFGSVLIGVAVLRVHRNVMHEQRIDSAVLKGMRQEQWLAALGIVFIVTGFFINFFYDL